MGCGGGRWSPSLVARHDRRRGRSVREDTVTWSDGLFEIFASDPAASSRRSPDIWEQVHPDDRARVIGRWKRGSGAPAVHGRAPARGRRRCGARDALHGRLIMARQRRGRARGRCLPGRERPQRQRARPGRLGVAISDRVRERAQRNRSSSTSPRARGRLTAVNRALAELTGRTEEEPSGPDVRRPGSRRGTPSSTCPSASASRPADRALLDREAGGARRSRRLAEPERVGTRPPAAGAGMDRPGRGRERAQAARGAAPLHGGPRSAHRSDQPASPARAALERGSRYSGRYGGEGALVLVDLDGLKEINDFSGHATGDAVLRRVAEVMHGARALDGRRPPRGRRVRDPAAERHAGAGLGARSGADRTDGSGGSGRGDALGQHRGRLVRRRRTERRRRDRQGRRRHVPGEELGGGVVEPSPALAAARNRRRRRRRVSSSRARSRNMCAPRWRRAS